MIGTLMMVVAGELGAWAPNIFPILNIFLGRPGSFRHRDETGTRLPAVRPAGCLCAKTTSPAARRRVQRVGQPVQGQVEPAVEGDQLGQDGGQGGLGMSMAGLSARASAAVVAAEALVLGL
jgi:hypothetical protein